MQFYRHSPQYREAYLLFLREAVLRLDREPTAAASNNHGPIRSISSAAAVAGSNKDRQKASKKRIIPCGDESCPHPHSQSIRCEVSRKLDPVREGHERRSLRGYSYPGAIPASTPEDPVLCCSCGL